MILYKYTEMRFLQSCFDKGVYASSLDNVNDPFEQDGIEYPELYRICCMTKSYLKMLMWSYYGGHQGCCVGFEVPDNLFRQVEYISEYEDHSEMSTDEVIESLYHKGNEWNHEEEYRAVYYRRNDDKIWMVDNEERVFLRATVKKVILGFFAHKSSEYKEALELLDSKTVEVSKCKLKRGQYAFYPNRQFDIKQELENLRVNSGKNTECKAEYDDSRPIPGEKIRKLFGK